MNIYGAIQTVMNECGAVAKDSKNPQQGYKYRGIDAVMNAINPALRKAGVFVVPEVLDYDCYERANNKGTCLLYSRVKVKYTFYAADGSFVTACVVGEGMDTGDKSMNKAMSAAFKYALFQTFCIPTEEMLDSEQDSPEPIPKNMRPDTNAEPEIKEPKKPIEIKNPTAQDIQDLAKEVSEGMTMVTDEQIGHIQKLARERGVMASEIYKRYNIKSLKQMTQAMADRCILDLQSTRARK